MAVAALQQATDEQGASLFLLKGGTLLQHRLVLIARATKDVDGLIRGDIDVFLGQLTKVFDLPWGPFTLSRSPVEVIETPNRIIKPRRFNIILAIRGETWRRIQIEIAPDEGGAGSEAENFFPPNLRGFGLPQPEQLAGLALRYQIAQKFHACSDPHNPPTAINDRARDVVDLILLQQLAVTSEAPTLTELRTAAQAIFTARATDAAKLGLHPRPWPPTVVAHPHWAVSYTKAAESANIDLPLDAAVAGVNTWIQRIHRSP
ncbi:MAG: nucleotidyl transferase AbiEii/AbiGii toxin family protein [Angustibacter sp.]